jgi:hypothetical protein
MENALRLAQRLRRYEIEVELISTLAYISNSAGDLGSSEKYFELGMNLTSGPRSEICRCNFGIAKGEG